MRIQLYYTGSAEEMLKVVIAQQFADVVNKYYECIYLLSADNK